MSLKRRKRTKVEEDRRAKERNEALARLVALETQIRLIQIRKEGRWKSS